MPVIYYIPLFLVILVKTGLVSTTESRRAQVIFDITQIVKNGTRFVAGNGTLDLSTAFENIALKNKEEKGQLLLYYTSDLTSNVRNIHVDLIHHLIDIQKTIPSFKPKLIASFKDEQWSKSQDISSTAYVEQQYTNLLFQIAKHASMFAGVSFENSHSDYTCQQSSGTAANYTSTSLVKEIKQLAVNHKLQGFSSGQIRIGYVVDLKHIDCHVHTENIKNADYVVVNIPLKLNDNMFVESYGISKERMDSAMGSVGKNTGNKTVYMRLQLETVLERGKLEANVITVGVKVARPDIQGSLNTALQQLQDINNVTAYRYQQLLAEYVNEWISEKKNGSISVILNYLDDGKEFVNNAKNLKWMSNNSGIIPYLTHLPLLRSGDYNSGLKSLAPAEILLDDILTSGFNTIMVDTRIWREVAKNSALASCIGSPGNKTLNVMYVVGEEVEPSELKNVCGLNLETFVFSGSFVERFYNKWEYILSEFRRVKNDSSNSTQRSACISWSGFFSSLTSEGKCDIGCMATTLQYLQGCKEYDTLIWSVAFNFFNDQVDKFVPEIMQRLDSFVIARQILFHKYQNKKVILQIRGDYTGDTETGRQASLYCSKLGERIGQFYEAILTWARIHDFPVIIDTSYYSEIVGYTYPFSWEQLSTTAVGPMQKVMTLGPLFIRRSYNQSKVFGSWTQGMYPCIVKATRKADVANLNFHHDFSGAIVNFNLRDGNFKLKPEDVQTLLLFALEKLAKVEISVSWEDDIALLSETISSSQFKNNLKLNGITKKKMYFLVQNISMDSLQHLNKVATVLKSAGCSGYIHSPDIIENKPETLFETGIVLPNCTDLAYKILLDVKNLEPKLRKVNYLVCDTEPISAYNRDEIKIQDYLNSHLYLTKFLRNFYPNLKEIHFRLHPSFHGQFRREKAENLFLFLSDLNAYAKAYKIHYFLLPAFVSEGQVEMTPTFWTITNYANLTKVSVFRDNHADFFNQVTWIPRISNRNYRHGNNTSNKDVIGNQSDKMSKILDESPAEVAIAMTAVFVLLAFLLILPCLCRLKSKNAQQQQQQLPLPLQKIK